MSFAKAGRPRREACEGSWADP